MDQLETKLQHAFEKGLGLTKPVNHTSLTFARSEGWDSIAHMRLIAAIETEFNIMIETNDVLAMSSYPVAKEIVEKYLRA